MIALKNCMSIATFDREERELSNHDIIIEGNKIKKISKTPSIPKDFDGEVIDCSNHVVLPGFTNTHHHMFQSLTRNLKQVQNAKLFDWLTFLYNIWADIDEDCVYYSTLLCCAELILTGCSSSSDHMYLYPSQISKSIVEIQFEAAKKAGVRFSPSRGAMTRGKSDGGLPPDKIVQKWETVLKDMDDSIAKFHDPSPFSMNRVILAPCSPFTVEKNLMKETAILARSKNVMMHTHLAETRDEDNYCMEIYGKRPLELMSDLDWLGKDVYFAHGIHFTEEELNLLAQTDTGVSHCPTSNMRLGSGTAKIAKMKELGVRISLGVDGSSSNDTSDMLAEVRNALLLARVWQGPEALTARDVLRFATKGGAQMLGFENSGTLEEGKAADIAIFDLSGIDRAGSLSDPIASLVFTGFSHKTAYTIINGKIVARDGHVNFIDERYLTEKVNNLSKKLIEKSLQ